MNANPSHQDTSGKSTSAEQKLVSAPSISLPKGGGAVRGIGEKFAANPVTGTGSLTVPIATSPGRSGFGPQLSLSYDSGSGNGPFGLGWGLSLPAITRKTDKGLPQYQDANESDVFILSGAEDLVPVYRQDAQGNWVLDTDGDPVLHEDERNGYLVRRYRPRVEGTFARIERWTNQTTGEIHWRSISRDNITTLYGKDNYSRIFDPAELDQADPIDLAKAHPTRVFSWLICQSYDAKGNTIVYEYECENSQRIFENELGQPVNWVHERNRNEAIRSTNRYLKCIKYGNRVPNRDLATWEVTDLAQLPDDTWMFKVVFDYGEGHYSEEDPDAQGNIFAHVQMSPPVGSYWPPRQDPFSSYRAGFEIRTYRLCQRVLMFHRFPHELGTQDCLVRSTEFSYLERTNASFIRSVTQAGFLRQPTQAEPNRYLKKSLPPLEFKYSQVPSPTQLAQQPVLEVNAKIMENLPVGLDGIGYQWVDLDGEGLAGILAEQADGWYYKRNLSANHQITESQHEHTIAWFGPLELVAKKPKSGLIGGAQFLDLAGDGQVDLVQMEGTLRGFYERTREFDWSPFQPFVSSPDLYARDPDLKFVDLTGDGHADILITEGGALFWYPSLGEEGFRTANRVNVPFDEEKGPRLVFADRTESIYLADLAGDGLADLVRIRNGEICYWPNLGYGHFGAKVTMENAPWFDAPDQFDQRRIRLADIDGSGTTDIFYLRRDGVKIYFNRSGNSWSDAVSLTQFPALENISAIQVVDLLGNGTACLVWSSPLPGNVRRPLRYIALMEEKPHLLVGMRNNLGAETRVKYAPSTKFYLNDKEAGKPWISRLPFPVHAVERVETWDWIGRNRFVSRYAYHHGYFDGPEREFRGFGMVEQWDTEEIGTLASNTTDSISWNTDDTETQGPLLEPLPTTNWDTASYVPPVLIRTWFHTGAFLQEGRISTQYVNEYYHEGDVSDQIVGLENELFQKELLKDTVLPTTIRFANGSRVDYDLSADEIREACRSLKGSILRQEIYALDGTDAEDRPYTASERNYTIELFQPRFTNQHAVFFTHAREQVDFNYERLLVQVNGAKYTDPRVSQSMILEVDAFGNALRNLSISYPRRDLPSTSIPPEQKETHLTLMVNRVANRPDYSDWHYIGVPIESQTFEIVKPPEPDQSSSIIQLFQFDAMTVLTETLFSLNLDQPETTKLWPYEKWGWRRNPSNAPPESRLRLIEHLRTKYRSDDLTSLLPLGDVQALALPGESYQLAFTPDLFKKTYIDSGKVTSGEIDNLLATEARYVHSEGDANWWIPSGRIFFAPHPNDSSAQELAFARQHFFLPYRFRDSFNNESIVAYDADPADPTRNHNLFIIETKDALDNIMTVTTRDDAGNVEIRHDYRVLQPYWITDPNGNRTQVAFDVLGLVVGTAVMGKPGENKGDDLGNFEPNLTQGEIDAFHDSNDPHALAAHLLQSASTRIIYDLHRFYHSRLAHPTDSMQWEPSYAATLARETHARDSLPAHGLKIQISFGYSDGFGREIQQKLQAEPGLVKIEDTSGAVTTIDTTPKLRWVGSGWVAFNNKGKPVRQYEPFFSAHHHFQYGKKIGVSPILFYDPVERVVATLHPNHTWEKVGFNPWQQTNYDMNDTISLDPKTDPNVGPFFTRLPDEEYLPSWYQQRISGAMGAAEKSAAEKAAQHADTPTTSHFDTLGKTYLTIEHNRFERNNAIVEEKYSTRIVYDIEGNAREVIDTKDRVVIRYDYDMLGSRVYHASMEAGERWTLNDCMGTPIRGWDSRGFVREITYDELHRPIGLFVTEDGVKRLAEQTIYGESQGDQKNHKTRIYQVKDSAGIITSESYDFKGNVLLSKRELLPDYQHAVNWTLNPIPNDGTFNSSTEYDALNRPLSVVSPDGTIYYPTFNEANLLNNVEAILGGNGPPIPFVINIDYNAKGQRTLITYGSGNGTTTIYEYDPLTYRLTHLRTARPTGLNGPASQLFQTSTIVQDLYYTHDPIGNILRITDDAISVVHYNNETIEPKADYTYDSTYRLVSVQGREQITQTSFDFSPPEDNYREYPFFGLHANPNDPKAVRNFTETYAYDKVDNIEEIRHSATNGNWKRLYTFAEASLIEGATKHSNRLTHTKIGNGLNFAETYSYVDEQGKDVNGCMTSINMLQMHWNFKDQLQTVDLAGGGIAYYVYDASGQRVRKVIHRPNGSRQKERIYIGNFERYREFNGSNGEISLERETLFVMDDKQRVARVETRTQGLDNLPEQLIRYQFVNHLESVSLELDDHAQVVSYEEYYPYGGSSYQAVRSETEKPTRYRFTGKERDEESGFYYHGARYYAPWLGRWISTDPLGIGDSVNLFCYVNDKPITSKDPSGMQSTPGANDLVDLGTYVDRGAIYRRYSTFAGDFVFEEYVGPASTASKPAPTAAAKKSPPKATPKPAPKKEPEKSTLDKFKEAEFVQGAGGFLVGAGLAQVPFIGPLIGPGAVAGGVVDKPTKTFEWWYGAGEFSAGVVQIITGIGTVVGGGGGTIGGAVATPFTGGLSLALSAVGVGAVAAGGVMIGQGMANLGAGIAIMSHAGGREELPEGTHKIVEDPNADLTRESTHSEALGDALEKELKEFRPSDDYEAHHIVAWNDPRAATARNVLEQAGIDVDSPLNGIWLRRATRTSPSGSVTEAFSEHGTLHTKDYFEYVNQKLSQVDPHNTEAVIGILNDLKAALKHGAR